MVDECVHNAVVEFLAKLGHDTVPSPYRSTSFEDPALLVESARQGRILITTDPALPMHLAEYVEGGNEHPGVLMGVQGHPIGKLLQQVKDTVQTLDTDNLRNTVLWLS